MGLGVRGHGVLTSEELSRNLGEALVDHVLINEAAAVALVRRHVLSAHHVGGSCDPVHSGETLIPEHVQVDLLRSGQMLFQLQVPCGLQVVKSLGAAANEADFSADSARRLAKELLLGGDEASVPGNILLVPGPALALNCVEFVVGPLSQA